MWANPVQFVFQVREAHLAAEAAGLRAKPEPRGTFDPVSGEYYDRQGNVVPPLTPRGQAAFDAANGPPPVPLAFRIAHSARICSMRFIGAIGGWCIGTIGVVCPGALFIGGQRALLCAPMNIGGKSEH